MLPQRSNPIPSRRLHAFAFRHCQPRQCHQRMRLLSFAAYRVLATPFRSHASPPGPNLCCPSQRSEPSLATTADPVRTIPVRSNAIPCCHTRPCQCLAFHCTTALALRTVPLRCVPSNSHPQLPDLSPPNRTHTSETFLSYAADPVPDDPLLSLPILRLPSTRHPRSP